MKMITTINYENSFYIFIDQTVLMIRIIIIHLLFLAPHHFA